MVNKTSKINKSFNNLANSLVKKYRVTKSGSKKEVATRLWKLRQHVMTIAELKLVEDYLHSVKKMPLKKRYKGPRYYTRKNGNSNLYCADKNNCVKIN